jgi:hypothetical protein
MLSSPNPTNPVPIRPLEYVVRLKDFILSRLLPVQLGFCWFVYIEYTEFLCCSGSAATEFAFNISLDDAVSS